MHLFSFISVSSPFRLDWRARGKQTNKQTTIFPLQFLDEGKAIPNEEGTHVIFAFMASV